VLVSLSRAVFLPVHLFREYRAARRLVRDQRRSDFDRAYDVDTDGDFGGWTYLSDLSIPSPNWIHGNNYTGIDPERFSGILAGVTIKFEDFVFIDFGSGKGRALLLASEFPFKRIVGVEFSPELHAAAVDNIRRMVQQDPTILDQVMRTVPSYDSVAGRLRGFRAYPGRNRQIFNKLGLKPGDLVTAINGTPLDDPQRSQDVFNTIQTSDHVTVTLERGGQKQDITLNIAQVAAQATKELDSEANSATGGPPNGAPPPPGNPSPNSSNENPNE